MSDDEQKLIHESQEFKYEILSPELTKYDISFKIIVLGNQSK